VRRRRGIVYCFVGNTDGNPSNRNGPIAVAGGCGGGGVRRDPPTDCSSSHHNNNNNNNNTTTTAATATTTAAETASAASETAEAQLAAMMDTTAHSWCPTIPLSTLTVDWDGIASGDVQSLHASVYVLWSDEVAETPVSSTRRFINTFLVGEGDEDDDVDSENAVATLARLPYDRISVDATNASESITFVSNDV
ncbi:unnamed protein product, partial [Ectocarpus sp. 8 AP-2014]